jgi:thiol-disulfide isomerase/thioredoxin
MKRQTLFLSFAGVSAMVAIVSATKFSNAMSDSKPTETMQVASEAVQIASAQPKQLASKLQGKPVVVDIYASWCPGCKNIAPTLSRLKQQYQGKVHFVVFDVTDRSTTRMAEAKAKQLGLSDFLAANKSQTSLVAIIDPSNGKVLKQFRNNPNQDDYTMVLNSAITQMAK